MTKKEDLDVKYGLLEQYLNWIYHAI